MKIVPDMGVRSLPRRQLAIAIWLAATPAIALDIDAAMPVLRSYVAAIAANDCDMAWRLTSNAIKRRDKYPGEFRDVFCPLLARMQASRVTEALSQPVAHLSDGQRHAVFVPSKRRSQAFNYEPVTDLMYVVYSHDDGATWEVLDLACVDQRWVREVFPAYRGEPPLPIDQARALAFLPW
jgi:hypothetical protein